MMILGVFADGRKLARETAPGPAAGTASVTIEFSGIRVIEAVIAASIDGGYKVDAGQVSFVGNKVTVTPQYYDYAAAAAGPAVDVPATDDLSARTIDVTIIGY